MTKYKPAMAIGLAVLFVGTYSVFLTAASPRESSADPPPQPCLPFDAAIIWSEPADGFIDVKEYRTGHGIRRFTVKFDTDLRLIADCIDIVTTGGVAPLVQDVVHVDGEWIIELDRPIPMAKSAAIVFDDGMASVVVHSHPGDVNFDGITNHQDLEAVSRAVQSASADVESYDLDGNGAVNAGDTISMAHALTLYENMSWSSTDEKRVLCCCCLGTCSVYVGPHCPETASEIDCPCVPNPCGQPPG